MSMSGGGLGGSGGGGFGGGFRSFRQERTVTSHELAPGTVRRVLGFARPYRRLLTVFLVIISFDALIGAATPLVFKAIIDDGITPGRKDVVVWLAVLVAALALATGGLALAQRWLSSRIGEGLIFDLRTAVFDHVQQMPLAFFSRTRTGALVQRLNGDVLGAQQAFTSTLSNVFSNSLTVIFVLAAMMSMSWQLTLLSLVLLPAFIFPARWVGPRLAAISREGYSINADTAQTDTFIEKDSSINDEVERLRHSATSNLLTRRDVVVVASVSCIYGLGTPQEYVDRMVRLDVGDQVERDALLRKFVTMQYTRNDIAFTRGTFRVRGEFFE